MLFSQFLDAEAVRIDVSANGKRSLLHHLAGIAAGRIDVPAATVAACLAQREKLGSTGFGGGVAIPHGKLEGLPSLYALVARLADPVDYKAIDGMPVDLVFLLLSPPGAGADHLKALAMVSRLARDPTMLAKLRGARSRDAFAAVLIGTDERDAA